MPVITNLFDEEVKTENKIIPNLFEDTPKDKTITGLFNEEKPKTSLLQEAIVKPAKTFYGGVLKSAANLADTINFYSKKLIDLMPNQDKLHPLLKQRIESNVFEYLRDNWSTYGEKLQKEGVSNKLVKEIYSGLGEAGFEIPKLMALGSQGLVISGAAEGGKVDGVKGAVTGAVTGGLTKGMLKGLNVLPTKVKLPTAFGVGAVTTPGGLEEKVAGGAVFTGLSLGESPSMQEFKETQKYSPLVKGYQKILPYETRERIYQNYINRFQSIENIVQKAKDLGAKILPGENPALRARTYLGIGQKVKTVLEDKTYKINPDGTFTITGEGLKPILNDYDKRSPIKNRNIREKDLKDYLIARRTIEDLQRPKGEWTTEQIVTPKQVKIAQNTLNNLNQKYGKDVSHLDQTASRLYDYQKRILHTLVDSGNLSQKQYDLILAKNPHYVPFDRVIEGVDTAGTPVSKNRFTGAKAPIKRIKGSELDIHNPIESMIKNTYRIMDISERNTVARGVAKLSKILPEDISPVRVRMQPVVVKKSEVLNVVEQEAINKLGEKEDVMSYLFGSKEKDLPISKTTDEAKTIFRPSQFKPKGNVIEYFDNGKRSYIEVTPNLYQAMTGLNETSLGMLTKIMSIPAQTLRTGATITPEFMFRNPIRDQWTAFQQTNLGWKPFVDTGAAIADIIGKSEVYNDWLRSGGAYSGFVEVSRENMQKVLKDLQGKPNLIKNLNIISKAQDISQLFEQATRLGVYKAGIKKGFVPVEAGFQSREATVDFGRKGAKTKDINAVIAFFNAGIQGTDKLVRSAREDPAGFAAKGIATITIPSLISYMLNRDDPEYKELPRWQKDLFWMFKVNDTWIRMPKSFAYGQIFGSLPERFFEYLDTQDPQAFNNLNKSLYDSLLPTSGDPVSGVMATGIKPLIENATNWSFFRERPILPEGKARKLPAEQYTRYTSETAKEVGKLINYSPAKIENLIQGWFGGSGRYALDIADIGIKAIKKTGGAFIEPKKPTDLADIPLIKGFVVRRPEGSQSESVNNFYKNMDKIIQVNSTIKQYLQSKNNETAEKLKLKYPEFRAYQGVNKTAKVLSDLSNYSDYIIRSNKPEKEKRELLKGIDRRKTEIAQKANKAIENFKGKKNLVVPNLFE